MIETSISPKPRKNGAKRVTISAGGFFVSNRSVVVSTLLGSCVAACLYDPLNGVVGMNHFLLSSRRYARSLPVCTTDAGRYGIHAMELLIREMVGLGAEKRHIRAKAFGGGSLSQLREEQDNFFCVGEVNIRFIEAFLANEGIPLMASDLGGDRARVIHFSSEDYSVIVRRVRKPDQSRLVQKERHYWQVSMA